MPPTLLQAQGLCKSYPGVQALSGVDFDLRAGEVHALVGENGAGKSTLARLICGLTSPDSGRMLLDNAPHIPSSRTDAESRGVAMVMQELNLIGTLTVAENIFLNRMPRRLGFIAYRRMNDAARAILLPLGLGDIDPRRMVETLGVGQQQMVEIASILSRRCRVLVLDEPTAALTERETELLFEQIRRLKSAGVGIIYISHRMEEIKRIADRISILRDGRWVATHRADDIGIDQVIRLMVGRELPQSVSRSARSGDLALRVVNLRSGRAVRDVSFEAQAGQILGFAGLMGSGRTETMRAIFGADHRDGGQIYLRGLTTPARIRSPRDAVKLGIALLTEDRKQQGLLLPMSISANTTLTNMSAVARFGGWIHRRREFAAADRLARALSLRCRSIERPVLELSGGNQQKVVLAKWLYRNCDIMIFDEPTRGIDVGAKFEVYQLLSDLAAAGKAIIMVSSDLQELMAVSDRIAVMSAGRLVRTFDRGEWTQDSIMTAALSGYLSAQQFSPAAPADTAPTPVSRESTPSGTSP